MQHTYQQTRLVRLIQSKGTTIRHKAQNSLMMQHFVLEVRRKSQFMLENMERYLIDLFSFDWIRCNSITNLKMLSISHTQQGFLTDNQSDNGIFGKSTQLQLQFVSNHQQKRGPSLPMGKLPIGNLSLFLEILFLSLEMI